MEFHFKQFSVKHDKSAMKVGTDGNLLGAWCDVSNKKRGLDLGTGTGLIALMMAQRNRDLIIDAIDIDENSVEEASYNVERSPFRNQINVKQKSFEDLEPSDMYDIIVSNPPFFYDQTLSKNASRIRARQGEKHWTEWLPKISSLLSTTGSFDVIFPIDQKEKVLELAKKSDLYLFKDWTIFPKPNKIAHRCLFSLKKSLCKSSSKELIIETDTRHTYTAEYQFIMKDYLTIF